MPAAISSFAPARADTRIGRTGPEAGVPGEVFNVETADAAGVVPPPSGGVTKMSIPAPMMPTQPDAGAAPTETAAASAGPMADPASADSTPGSRPLSAAMVGRYGLLDDARASGRLDDKANKDTQPATRPTRSTGPVGLDPAGLDAAPPADPTDAIAMSDDPSANRNPIRRSNPASGPRGAAVDPVAIDAAAPASMASTGPAEAQAAAMPAPRLAEPAPISAPPSDRSTVRPGRSSNRVGPPAVADTAPRPAARVAGAAQVTGTAPVPDEVRPAGTGIAVEADIAPARSEAAAIPAGVPDAGADAASALALTAPASAPGFAPQDIRAAMPEQPAAPARPEEQLAVRIASAVKGGHRSVSVEMRPEALGRVSVQLRFHEDKSVGVQVTAERHETYALLSGNRAGLERQLLEAGIALGAGGLDLRFGAPGSDRDSGQSPQPGAGAQAGAARVALDAAPEAVSAPRPKAGGASLIDIDA